MEQVLFKYIGEPEQFKIENYIKNGGYKAIRKVLKEYEPEDLIEEVKKSGVRGRGGAGFPAGLNRLADGRKQEYLFIPNVG